MSTRKTPFASFSTTALGLTAGLAALLGSAGPAAAQPRLIVSGNCPGLVFAEIIAQPSTRVALLFAADPGDFVIPDGNRCAGTTLGLGGARLRVAFQGETDGTGFLLVEGLFRRQAVCQGSLQVIEAGSCATSNVEEVPG